MSSRSRLEPTLGRLRESCHEPEVRFWEAYLSEVTELPGGDALLKRIRDAGDPESVRDHLITAYYALIFRRLRFAVRIEPEGPAGPDLEVTRDGRRAVIEVSRLRRRDPGPPRLQEALANLESMEFGNIESEVRKIVEKVRDKFRQVAGSSDALVAIWNDDGSIGPSEAQDAVRSLGKDAGGEIVKLPDRLHGVIYGSHGAHSQQHQLRSKQFFFWPLQDLTPPIPNEWIVAIEDAYTPTLLPKPKR